MLVVTLALYAEGKTDGSMDEDFDFLPQIILRTTESILLQHGWPLSEIDIQLPYRQCKKPMGMIKRDMCILHVSQEIAGYHALIIHSDGDDRGYERTLIELFQPGKDLVLAARDMHEYVCADLVPIIPMRMIEAWMLADPDALCTVLGTKIEASTLGIPVKAKLVEKELDPKATLDLVIRGAYPGQTRVWRRFKEKLYRELGSQISLKRLGDVPSYQLFVRDLTATLRTLNFIRE